jgi:hypothetical protein
VKPGIWSTNKALGKAERELAGRAEVAYRRLVAEWQSQRKGKGAGVPVGRDSSSHLLAEETVARQGSAPEPALPVPQNRRAPDWPRAIGTSYAWRNVEGESLRPQKDSRWRTRGAVLRARLRLTGDELALYGVVVLLVAGFLLRLVFMAAWRPAFFGYPDSIVYIQMAGGPLFGSPIHAVGYPIFLRVVHDLVPHLAVTIAIQHVFGLASGVILYLTVRRAGGPPWLGLVPMAVVVLNGAGMFLEHAPLTEPLYIFIESFALYAAIRTIDDRDDGYWAAAAGLLAGTGAIVRTVGLPLVAGLVAWLLIGPLRPRRRRFVLAGIAAACAIVVLGSFVIAQNRLTGYTGLTPRAGVWDLYGRVAPFADCSKFTPPAGTRVLCESKPRSERPRVEQYEYDPAVSPAVQAFGFPGLSTQADNEKVAAFARAVILHQPLDYLEAVGKGMFGYTQPLPPHGLDLELGDGYEHFFHNVLFDSNRNEEARVTVLPYYQRIDHYQVHASLMRFLFHYERATRVNGVLMVVLLLLSLLAPFVTHGYTRRAVALITVLAWISLVTPVATHWWDARLTVPILGPLAAAAALGGWALVQTVRGRLAKPRP